MVSHNKDQSQREKSMEMFSPIRRVYVDTSVVGGLFDEEFMTQTTPFWNAVRRGDIIVLVSDWIEQELEKAPHEPRNLINSLPQTSIERITLTDETYRVADRYIEEKVVGRSSRDDCVHIALASIAHADVLVSWNFKHIVNANRIRGYNAVNRQLGYPTIDIRTPYEVIHDDI